MNKALVLLLIFAPLFAQAQKVDLNKLEDGTTTYEISKNKKSDGKCDPIWEITDGTADISGDPTIMSKDARENWQKACDAWKKEFRADNKENKIINMACGKPECTNDAAGKVCTSTASYKIKTKLN